MTKNSYRTQLENIVKYNKKILLDRTITNITVRIYSVIVFPCIDYLHVLTISVTHVEFSLLNST